MTPLELALAFWSQGILVVPTAEGRKPIAAYSAWRETWPDEEQYKALWRQWNDRDPQILTGLGTFVEMVDVDLKNDPDKKIVADFEYELKEFAPDLFAKLYIEETPSGGRHYGYKTAVQRPKRDLAFFQDPDTPFERQLDGKWDWKPVIEIQAANALCRCWPTKGFKVVQGDILDLPTLEAHEISLIEHISREFDRKPAETIKDEPRRERMAGETPGNDYANNVSLIEICGVFEKHGWLCKQRGNRIYMRRPGAKTKNFDGDIKNRLFMAFSSSVSDFQIGEGYNFFRCYAILEHNGDFSAAAKALREQGWGGSHEITLGASNNKTEVLQEGEAAPPTIWERVAQTRVLISKPPQRKDYALTWTAAGKYGGKTYNLAAYGSNVLLSGAEKARKTSLLTAIIASGLCGQPRIGFKLELEAEAEVVFLDTEQDENDQFFAARRIVIQAMKSEFPANCFFYSLLDFEVKERVAALEAIIQNHPKLKVLVIDGIVDFIEDFNSAKESAALGNKIMRMTRDIMVFHVMHINRGLGQANGHWGAFWQKKCKCHIKVMLNEDHTSEVTFPHVRGERPDSFSFSIVGPNIPVADGYPKPNFDFSIGSDSEPNNKYFPTEERPPLNPSREEPDDLGLTAEMLGMSDEELNEC